MFPRPISMKDNQAILALVTRLKELNLLEVVSNANGSQAIRVLSPNLDRELLVATDGQVYLLADIKNYLATASDADIQAQTVTFPQVMIAPVDGTVLYLPIANTTNISLAELKASPAKLAHAKYFAQFSSLLSQLNLSNYSENLQQTIAILGNRNLDSLIAQTLNQIAGILAQHHAVLLRDTDGKIFDATNIQNLDADELLSFTSAISIFQSDWLTPNSLVTDTWLCTITAKLKLKNQLIAELEQTTDVEPREALQQEINHVNKSINDYKTLLKLPIASLKLASKALKLAEEKYQAHVLKYPNFEAELAAKRQLDLKPPVTTRRDKILNALGISARFLAGLLLVGTIIGLTVASAVLLTLALTLALTVTPVGLAVLAGLAAFGILIADAALTFNSLKIMRAFSDRVAQLGDYIKKQLAPQKHPSLSNDAMNTYANTRPSSIMQKITETEQNLNKLQTVLAKITTLEATYNVIADKEAKQQIKGNTVPTDKFAGTLFSVAPVEPVEQAAAQSSLRRHSR